MNTELINPSERFDTIELSFFGPFSFVAGSRYLFECEYAYSEGVYIWTIKDGKNNINYVHYVGETTGFASRHRDHVIHIMGLNYRILDPDYARQGVEKFLWEGLWRKKTSKGVGDLINIYSEISKKTQEYIGLINVYFAPIKLPQDMRRHIEGCLGWNFRNKYPDLKKFYPDDNHIGTKVRFGKKLIVNLPESIAGIDREQLY